MMTAGVSEVSCLRIHTECVYMHVHILKYSLFLRFPTCKRHILFTVRRVGSNWDDEKSKYDRLDMPTLAKVLRQVDTLYHLLLGAACVSSVSMAILSLFCLFMYTGTSMKMHINSLSPLRPSPGYQLDSRIPCVCKHTHWVIYCTAATVRSVSHPLQIKRAVWLEKPRGYFKYTITGWLLSFGPCENLTDMKNKVYTPEGHFNNHAARCLLPNTLT